MHGATPRNAATSLLRHDSGIRHFREIEKEAGDDFADGASRGKTVATTASAAANGDP